MLAQTIITGKDDFMRQVIKSAPRKKERYRSEPAQQTISHSHNKKSTADRPIQNYLNRTHDMKNTGHKLMTNNSSTVISNKNCTEIITKVFLADGNPQRNLPNTEMKDINAERQLSRFKHPSRFSDQRVKDSPKNEEENTA